MGLLRSATGKVGCLPLMRNSSLVTVGCAGSSLMGPAPLAGCLSPALTASQLTPPLAEKLGGAAAPSADENATTAERRPKVADNDGNLDMVFSLGSWFRNPACSPVESERTHRRNRKCCFRRRAIPACPPPPWPRPPRRRQTRPSLSWGSGGNSTPMASP